MAENTRKKDLESSGDGGGESSSFRALQPSGGAPSTVFTKQAPIPGQPQMAQPQQHQGQYPPQLQESSSPQFQGSYPSPFQGLFPPQSSALGTLQSMIDRLNPQPDMTYRQLPPVPYFELPPLTYTGQPQVLYGPPTSTYYGHPQRPYSGLPASTYSEQPRGLHSGQTQRPSSGLPASTYSGHPQGSSSGLPGTTYSGHPQGPYSGQPASTFPGHPQGPSSGQPQGPHFRPPGSSYSQQPQASNLGPVPLLLDPVLDAHRPEAKAADEIYVGKYRECPKCLRKFFSQADVDIHLKEHYDHHCQICDTRYKTEDKLKIHLTKFHSGLNKTPECLHCKATFPSLRSFKIHTEQLIVDSTGIGKNKVKCPICGITKYGHDQDAGYELRRHYSQVGDEHYDLYAD